jgi:hypothetical protein
LCFLHDLLMSFLIVLLEQVVASLLPSWTLYNN